MAILSELLSNSGRFSYSEESSKVLDDFVGMMDIESSGSELMLGSLEAGAAEVAISLGATGSQELIQASQLAKKEPITVGAPEALLSAILLGCNPFDCPGWVNNQLKPDSFRWTDILISTGDVRKATMAWGPNSLINLQETFVIFSDHYQDIMLEGTTTTLGLNTSANASEFVSTYLKTKLGLWRIRVDLLFGVRDRNYLLEHFNEIVS